MSAYDDIINLPHPTSANHPRMSMHNRAAQFAPFAALTGYEDAIDEEGRLTEDKIELDEQRREVLDEKIRLLMDHRDMKPDVKITYYVPDKRKEGGAYNEYEGVIKKIDVTKHIVVFEDGFELLVENLFDIESSIFNGIFD
ncbi:MAG: YolD-like family protein [Lachnospiraceae bacterium]|jgi:hypothetical protein|nr:YolD-like family protein [Lachnospiraceae bacterium]